MKIDQVAVVTNDADEAVKNFESVFGCKFTAQDTVTAIGLDATGELILNIASLRFAYDLSGMEFEVLEYKAGWNWHAHWIGGSRPRLSHWGVHVATESEIDAYRARYSVLQEVVTTKHTNPMIADSRRYHYTIFNTREELGAELKLIRRLSLQEAAEMRERFLK